MVSQLNGQMSIFDILDAKKGPYAKENEVYGEDCERCDCQWCSIKCFTKRGYIWDPYHRFMKTSDGKMFRKSIDNRECKKEYKSESEDKSQ